MSVFDYFKARVLEPLSAWTYKSPSPVYKRKYSDIQEIKKALPKYDPLQQSINKYGEVLAKRHLVGYSYNPKTGEHYPQFKYPSLPKTDAVKEAYPQYDPSFARKQLNRAPKGWERDANHSRLINFIDAETTKYHNILSWSRLGVTFNYKTGQFEYVSSENRFYYPQNGLYDPLTEEIHGLNKEAIDVLRGKQRYSKTYTLKEQQRLREQLRGSIVAGHNILSADIPWLFGNLQGMSTFDTLVAAQNLYGRGHNKLSELFRRLYKGAGIGIEAHLSQHDVLMNALVGEEMLRNPELFKDFQYIDKTLGAEYAPTDHFLGFKSSVVVGNQYVGPRGVNKQARWDATEDIYYANVMAEKLANEVGGSGYDPHQEIYGYDEDGYRTKNEGFSITEGIESVDPSLVGMSENAIDIETQKWLDAIEMKRRNELPRRKAVVHIKKKRPIDIEVEKIQSGGGQRLMEETEWKNFVAEIKSMILSLRTATGNLEKSYLDLGEYKGLEAARSASMLASKISGYSKEDQIDYLDALGIHGKQQEPYTHAANVIARVKEQRALEEQLERKQGRFDDIVQPLYDTGYIRKKTYERLTSELNDSTVSLKDFNRHVKEVTQTVEHTQRALTALNEVPFYDPQKLINVAQAEWGGIQHAASGFVPHSVMRPFSHLGNAAFNGLQMSLEGIKKYTDPINYGAQTVGNTLIGSGIVTLNPIAAGVGVGIKGISALGTQLYGRYKEHQIAQFGEEMQMKLNLVSAGVQTILLPFKLLAAASGRLLKVFGGLTAVVGGITISGLRDMQQMGNPLTNLTGVGYGAYMGARAGDYASLLSPGTTNAMMEDLARGSSGLYTLGQIDVNKLMAASMLGQFHNVYSMNPDSQENLTNMINGIYAQLKTADPIRKRDIMTYATTINPAMAQILQSMDTLGVENYEDFMNPEKRGVRWTARYGEKFMGSWRKQFQWDQYEYQAIGANIGFNKGRIAHSLWKNIGFPLYDGLNRVLEKVADGDWKGAVNMIGEGLENISKYVSEHGSVFKDLWNTIKVLFENLKKGKFGDIISGIGKLFRQIGSDIMNGLMDGIRPLFTFLDSIDFKWENLLVHKNPFVAKDFSVEKLSDIGDKGLAIQGEVLEKYKDILPGRYAPGARGPFDIGGLITALRQMPVLDRVPIMEKYGITKADLDDPKALAEKLGWQGTWTKAFDSSREGVKEAVSTALDAGKVAVESLGAGVSNTIDNIVNTATNIAVYLDGQEIGRALIEAGQVAYERGGLKASAESALGDWMRSRR